VQWYEGPHNAFVQGLLVDLRDAVWNLKPERADLEHALGDAVMQLNEQKKEATTLKKELAVHLCNNARLKKLERERLVLFLLCVCVCHKPLYCLPHALRRKPWRCIVYLSAILC